MENGTFKHSSGTITGTSVRLESTRQEQSIPKVVEQLRANLDRIAVITSRLEDIETSLFGSTTPKFASEEETPATTTPITGYIPNALDVLATTGDRMGHLENVISSIERETFQ